MKKFEIQHSNVEFKEKPNSTEIRLLNREIVRNSPTTINARELLIDILGNGKSVLTGIFNKRRSKSTLKQASILLLDFDNVDINNQYTINDLLEDDFMLNNAVGYYKTLSYTKEHEKFRVVFILPEPILTANVYEDIYNELLLRYPMADGKCKDVCRLFYGGTNPVLIDEENILNDLNYDLFKNNLGKSKKKTLENNHDIINALETRPPYNDINLNVIRNIKMHNWEGYREYLILNNLLVKKSFKNIREAKFYIIRLDMRLLLGIDVGNSIKYNPFNCFLRKDIEPSASIYKTKSSKIENNGVYLYKRFSLVDKRYDIFKIFEMLSGYSKLDSELMLLKLLNITLIEHPLDKKIMDEQIINKLKNFRKFIMSDSCKKETPNFYKVIKTFRSELDSILIMYEQNLYINYSSEMYFNTKTYLERIYGIKNKSTSFNNSKQERISKIFNLISHLGILHMKTDEEISENVLKNLNQNKKNKHYKFRTNVYSIKKDSFNLGRIEELSKELIDNHYTFTGFNSKFLMTIEINRENKTYVQYQQNLSDKDIQFKSYITNYIINYFENQNEFIFEYDIKFYLAEIIENDKRLFTDSYIKRNYNTFLPSILNELNLEKSRLTKDLKRRFNLTHLGAINYAIYYKK